MIDEIGPVGAVEPVSFAVASALASRQAIARREKRLRWLKSLHAAQNGGVFHDEEEAAERAREQEERLVADMRARIASTLSIVEAMGSLPDDADTPSATPSHATITAAELAHRIGTSGEQSLRAQARLGSEAVRQLVGWAR